MAAKRTATKSASKVTRTPRAAKRKAPVGAAGKAAASVTHERVAGMSAQAVKKATGCDWDSWFEWLDRKGANGKAHPEIVKIIDAELKRSPWWSQMITVAYEQARGMRVKHQKVDGFSGSASKTLAISAVDAFQWFADETKRARWFSHPLEVKRATAPKSLRMRWADGTPLDVNITSKGDRRCSVACQHDRLKSAAEVTRMKALWKSALERLAEITAS